MREVCAIVRAKRFLPRSGRLGNCPAYRHQVPQIQPVVPAQVERARRIAHASARELGIERLELGKLLRETARVAQDADALPHRVVEALAQRLQIAGGHRKRPLASGDRRVDGSPVRLPEFFLLDEARHAVARDGAEHGGVGDAVPAQPIGAVHTA